MSLTSESIRSLRLAPSATFAPFAARRRAVLAPSPLLAPVMTTTLPLILDILVLSFSCMKNPSAFQNAKQSQPSSQAPDSPSTCKCDCAWFGAEVSLCEQEAE